LRRLPIETFYPASANCDKSTRHGFSGCADFDRVCRSSSSWRSAIVSIAVGSALELVPVASEPTGLRAWPLLAGELFEGRGADECHGFLNRALLSNEHLGRTRLGTWRRAFQRKTWLTRPGSRTASYRALDCMSRVVRREVTGKPIQHVRSQPADLSAVETPLLREAPEQLLGLKEPASAGA